MTSNQKNLPNCQVLITFLIRRSDNVKVNKAAEKVNNFIKIAKLKFINNGNITDKASRRGLHLNRNGNVIFGNNLLNAIRKWCEINDLVFNIYDEIKITYIFNPTKDVNKEYETKILDKQIKSDNKDNLRNIESDVSGLIELRKD